MSFRKICLIVDNPLRDLEGLTLLAWHLATPDCAVYLVPMYHYYEIFLIRPDFVLVNYIRGVNQGQVALFAELGIAVGVLDTEGGVLSEANINEMYRDLTLNINNIPLYCTWGEGVIRSMKQRGLPKEYNMVATGCPRYDYCSPEWSEALPRIWDRSRPMVLINTSLSMAFPRYQSVEREIHEAIHVQKIDPKWVHQRIEETRFVFEEIRQTIEFLAPRFPAITFVLRPHPFEDNTIFKSVTDKYPNVEMHQEGSVFPWIRDSLAMLHHFSTTSVDCIFMGSNPLQLDWIKSETIYIQIAEDVSIRPKSLQETAALLERINQGERLQADAEIHKKRQDLIREWFYANDGGSSRRVAAAINKVLSGFGPAKGKLDYFKILCWKLLKAGDWKTAIKRSLIVLLGSASRNWFKRAMKKAVKNSGKEFNLANVKGIVGRIESVKSDAPKAQVSLARESFRHPTPKTYFAIRISRLML